VSHLGQRLSALIDGELDPSERERVLTHVGGCAGCSEELAALYALKRRMSSLGEDAARDALIGLAGLTGRLLGMGLGQLAQGQLGADQSRPGAEAPSESGWPAADPAQQWQFPAQNGKSEQRAGRYFFAGSLAIFMAGLGTAAFIAGGEPQPSAPAAPVVPSVDVMVVPHELMNGLTPGRRPQPRPSLLGSSGPGSLAHR
jgi:anti-sigma factor RsiW